LCSPANEQNIPEDQRQLLRGWRIRVRQIGHEAGSPGMQDEEIIPLLHRTESSTFFTRDLGFYRGPLCHMQYCIVCLAVSRYEAASFIRRFLRHPQFQTQAMRLGKVIRSSHTGITLWQLHSDTQEKVGWPT
jgi:hypothetical protein